MSNLLTQTPATASELRGWKVSDGPTPGSILEDLRRHGFQRVIADLKRGARRAVHTVDGIGRERVVEYQV